MNKEPESGFPFVEVLIEGTNQVIRFYRDGNSDEGTYRISKDALLDVLFNQFKWEVPQSPIHGLSDHKIRELANKYLSHISYDEGEYGMEIEITGEVEFYDAIIEELNKKASEK